jgi:uncharacterized protein YbjT (DUF2867 family)
MNELFVTGGGGFIGRHLLARLRASAYPRVTVLTRSPENLARLVEPLSEWHYVAGDLEQPSSYENALPRGGSVIHLAAATGNAPKHRHEAVNVEATRELVRRCESRAIGRFIYVSSIAAKFTDQRFYPYAQSKVRAEAIVAASKLDYAIVRPTIVLGQGSPVMKGLRKLAVAPMAVLFGNGQVRVQPIDVDDLTQLLHSLITQSKLPVPRMVEAGGPQSLTMEELIRRIRRVSIGKNGAVLKIPAGPMRAMLASLEPVLGGKLPMTAGQLASFVNDGTTEPHPALSQLKLKDLDAMLGAATANA